MQTIAPLPVPRKSRRRWYLLGGFLLFFVGTPTAYYFFASWWADREMEAIYRETDAADPNWRWADLVAELKPPPDEANSAVQIVKVHELLKATPFNLNAKWYTPPNEPLRFPNAKLTVENAGFLRSAFSKLDPKLLEEARRLKDMPVGRFALDPDEIPLPPYALGRVHPPAHIAWSAAVELLQNDAILRAESGDIDGAAESCQALLNAIRAFKDWPVRWGQALRLHRQIGAVLAIERLLAQGEIDEAMLQRLQTLLEQEIADDGTYVGLRGERAAAHLTYLRLREGTISFTEVINGRGGTGGANFGPLLDAFPSAILNQYPDFLRKMNEQVPAAKLKDAARATAMGSIEEKYRLERGVLAAFLIPGIGDATSYTQASMRCAAAGLAAERFRLKHGFWPNDEDELMKQGLLKDVPKDPVDGQPMRWKPTATGLVIYCPGYTRLDYGGKLNRTGNPGLNNFDIGFELWAPKSRRLPAPVIVQAQ
jgi:hypothetical protein